MSPSFSFCFWLGMPWQTTSLIEVEIDLREALVVQRRRRTAMLRREQMRHVV